MLAALAAGVVMYFRTESYVTITFHMDTFISYAVSGRRPKMLVRELEKEADRLEKLFDRFSEGSEICRINDNAGNLTEVSEPTYTLICDSIRLSGLTDGAFDPTVGVLTDLWGFGKEPHVPQDAQVEESLKHVGYGSIRTEENNGRYYIGIAEGQKLDLGAIAKGYCLASFQKIIAGSKTDLAVISFGGNVLICGRSGEEVSVGVRKPEENDLSNAFVIVLESGVVSTSGSYERYFYENGVKYSHIIDPYDGRCVSGELLSVSVICDDPVEADCLSTAYFVKGLDEVLDALASGEISGAAIDRNNVIYISRDLMDRISPDSVNEGYVLEVVG